MSKSAESVFDEAMDLPQEQRAELAARLIRSLDPASEEAATAAWEAELNQRAEELDRGTAPPIPDEEARRRIRGRVGGAG